MLVSAAATCYDPRTGQVLIRDFYDGVNEPDARELDAIRETIGPNDLDQFRRDTGRNILYTDNPLEAKLRLWRRPTFEIHGIDGGYNDKPGIKTTIPGEVTLKVTMRVVPGQDPLRLIDLLRTHVQEYARFVHPDLNIEVTGDGSPGCMTSLDNAFMERAATACERGFGKKPLYVGVGGTIGAIPPMQRMWPQAPVILLAQSLMSDGYHGPNEEFLFSQAAGGIKAAAHYLQSIGDLRAA